jgi:hypothetical protein
MTERRLKPGRKYSRRELFAIFIVLATGRAGKDPKPRQLFTPEEIAEAERRRRSGGRYYTTKEVLAHLKALEELERIKQRRDSPGPWLTTGELKARTRSRAQS